VIDACFESIRIGRRVDIPATVSTATQ